MGSSRLPGKVAAEVAGRPMLRLMLDRLRVAQLDDLVVATSTEEGDDCVVAIAEEADVAVVRGSERDVLDRFRTVLEAYPTAEVAVRLTADCPLIDPGIVDQAIAPPRIDRGRLPLQHARSDVPGRPRPRSRPFSCATGSRFAGARTGGT